MRYAIRQTALVVALAVVLAGCSATRSLDAPVTVGASDAHPLVQRAFNTIWNVETPLLVAGEALLTARTAGQIDGVTWGRIADASGEFNEGLKDAKIALVNFQLQASADNGTRLDEALAVLSIAAGVFRSLAETNGVEVESR